MEKILEPGEVLPDWPVAGTTGYDAMREVNGVFVDVAGEAEATERYRRLTGDQLTSAEQVERGKRMIVDTLLVAEVDRIAALAPEVEDAAAAVAEVAVAFAVYRSYLPDGVADLDKALVLAEQRRPELASAFAGLVASPARRLGRAGPAVPAAERRHHGQGHRGHRLLPVRPLHRPQRGRRRRR